MTKNKTKYSERVVMSTTHLDKHGTIMTKEALESALKFINGDRKPRLGLEHNQTFPPLGRINNGEVFQGKDGEYYLLADQEYFDKVERIKLLNGLELFRHSFSEENYPFAECDFKSIDKIEILYDPANIENYRKGQSFIQDLKKGSKIEFNGAEFMRKSEIPDPEIIIRLTEILGIALGIGLRKIPEKLGEAIGNDLVEVYKLLKKTIKKSISELIPKTKPIHFIVEIPIEQSLVELIVTTRNPDVAINAYKEGVLSQLKQEIEISIKTFNAEKVQYFLNEDNEWELNYLLTKDGKVIGTKKSFKKRDDFFQEMVKIQQEKENNA